MISQYFYEHAPRPLLSCLYDLMNRLWSPIKWLPNFSLLMALQRALTQAREPSLSLNSASRRISCPQCWRTDWLTSRPGGTYLPLHRTYRVLIVPETRTTGFLFFFFFTLNTERKHLPLFRMLRLLSHPGFDSESRIVEVSFEMASPPQFIARVALFNIPGRMATQCALAGLDATWLFANNGNTPRLLLFVLQVSTST